MSSTMTAITPSSMGSSSGWASNCLEEIKKINIYHDYNTGKDSVLFSQLNDPYNELTQEIKSSLETIEKLDPIKLYSQNKKILEKIDNLKKAGDSRVIESLSNLIPSLLEAHLNLMNKCEDLLKAASTLAKSIDADQYIDEFLISPDSFVALRNKLLKECLKVHILVFFIVNHSQDRIDYLNKRFYNHPIKKEVFYSYLERNSFFINSYLKEVFDDIAGETIEQITAERDKQFLFGQVGLSKIMQSLDSTASLKKFPPPWHVIYQSCHPKHFEIDEDINADDNND